MSKSIIDRIGAERIIEVCSSVKTFKDACNELNCGYRYLVDAAIKLGCYEQLKERSNKFAHSNDFTKPWLKKFLIHVYTEQIIKFGVKSCLREMLLHLLTKSDDIFMKLDIRRINVNVVE